MRLKTLVLSIIVLAIVGGWIYSTILTVMPDASASKLCYLGYRAHCSFTPFSTIISIFAAGLTLYAAKKTLWRQQNA